MNLIFIKIIYYEITNYQLTNQKIMYFCIYRKVASRSISLLVPRRWSKHSMIVSFLRLIVYRFTARDFTVVVWIFFCYIFLVTNLAWFSSNGIDLTIVDSDARDFFLTENPLEEANIVVWMAALSLRRALNFFKHSTVPDSMLGY